MNVSAIKTRLFNEHESILEFLDETITSLDENSIVVIASKIVALSEGRTKPCASKEEKHSLAKQESELYIDTKWIPLTITNGMLMAGAGIDESNHPGQCLLLPKDSFASAEHIRIHLKQTFSLEKIGVIISDSRLFPLRQGVTGAAIGYAGFHGLKDYRGTKDLYGRTFQFESLNLADSLATAAITEMGEGAEQQPLAIISKPNVNWTNKEINKEELQISLEDDLYGPLFTSFSE